MCAYVPMYLISVKETSPSQSGPAHRSGFLQRGAGQVVLDLVTWQFRREAFVAAGRIHRPIKRAAVWRSEDVWHTFVGRQQAASSFHLSTVISGRQPNKKRARHQEISNGKSVNDPTLEERYT